MKSVLLCSLLLTVALIVFSCQSEKERINKAPKPVQQFDLKEVKLLDGPFKNATDLNQKMLLETFEPDRLLARFRIEADLKPKADPYEGWEAETIAGHSLGHYLKACALMYSTTGNEDYKNRVDYIVSELGDCQAADADGYIGAFKNGKKVFTEEVAQGSIRSQGFDLNGLWAPFYTQHKILAGLLAAKQHCENEQAIEVATKFSDWIYTVVDDLNEEQIQNMLHCEHGGINEAFAELFALTNDDKYLKLSRTFYHKAILDSLANEVDILPGKHANTQIPKLIGLSKLYELEGVSSDSVAALFFWDRVVHHHSYVTGGNGNHEYFGKPDQLSNRLSANTTETCNVYNMLKLSRHLFEWQPTAEVADFYERALFNHILASQHPETGRVIYNLSLEMGGYKVYQDPYWFTCCVGSGMETHSKYGANIYYHNNDELYVSQFVASEVKWEAKGVKLIQQTNYPEEQGTTLIIETDEPKSFDLKIRYPKWAKEGIKVRVNGEVKKVDQQAGSFISINREWENGDRIIVNIPFTLRVETMPDNDSRVAFMFGPLVLAGDLGEVDSPEAGLPDFVPVIMTETRDLNDWVHRIEGQVNTFETVEVGSPNDILLKPFYKIHDRRYSVYFDMFNEEQWQAYQAEYKSKLEAKKELERRTIDYFEMGEMQPERDHQLTGDSIYVDEMKGKKARVASRGGQFGFLMKVDPKEQITLVAEYWGGYTGSKTFDIFIEGQKIATENITDKQPGEFIDVPYQIPVELTSGKSSIRVDFIPHVGHRAGPVFSVRTVR